ncbi:MAG: hypothetical protein IPJ82_05985 [Lewinellaceae bacterium]|nr:hypothetical protein [Lewinellaceae bacterium]
MITAEVHPVSKEIIIQKLNEIADCIADDNIDLKGKIAPGCSAEGWGRHSFLMYYSRFTQDGFYYKKE